MNVSFVLIRLFIKNFFQTLAQKICIVLSYSKDSYVPNFNNSYSLGQSSRVEWHDYQILSKWY